MVLLGTGLSDLLGLSYWPTCKKEFGTTPTRKRSARVFIEFRPTRVTEVIVISLPAIRQNNSSEKQTSKSKEISA
jgi:hypothetical protein